MSKAVVRVERMGPHATLWFERPDKGPPVVTFKVITALEAAVKKLASIRNLRTVTLRSRGDGVFLAGGDLQEFSSLDSDGGRAMALRMRSVLSALEELPVPVIAALDGNAYGGGCELAIAADIRVATSSVHLSFSQGRFGVSTGWGGTTRLVHLVGPGRAMLILATGHPVGAAEALGLGLVEQVVPDKAALEERLAAMCASIEMIGPVAMRAIKRAVRNAAVLGAADAMAKELELFADCWGSPEHQEGLQAFFARRAPAWAQQGWTGTEPPAAGDGEAGD